MTNIKIPTVLRKFADGNPSVEVTGESVLEAVTNLTDQYPALKSHLFGSDGSLRSFVNIYVDDEDVRHKEGPSTSLKGGEVLSIIPAVAGGLR